ncbi:MAG: nuclear transport factor 2 family protein [Bacteroidales bacterium]|nr:nuclear transport factor 2 family protein [Bacteroidales bacterium]
MKSLIGICILTLLCICINGQDVTNDEEAIINLITCETEAYLNHNYDDWAANWAQTPYAHHVYTTSSHHQGLNGWEEMKTAFRDEFSTPVDPNYTIEKDEFNIHINGNTAVANFTEHYFAKGPVKTEKWSAKNNAMFEKVDGEWKIVGFNIVNQTTFKASEYDVWANLNLAGNMLLEMEDKESALKVFELCFEIQPEGCQKYNKLGEVFLNMGKTEVAKQYFNKCLIIEPQNEYASNKLKEIVTPE